eukprot:SAG31_NODE_1635_length_7682_cov_5.457471_1_plen_494_part_10
MVPATDLAKAATAALELLGARLERDAQTVAQEKEQNKWVCALLKEGALHELMQSTASGGKAGDGGKKRKAEGVRTRIDGVARHLKTITSNYVDDEADGVLAAPASGPQARAAPADDSGATKVTVKTEDGGWTAEFQPLRQKRFDEKEYARLHGLFFAEYTVEAGVRESRTRRGTLRTTVRETGTTTRIAKWPRLQNVVQQLHEDGNKEEALKHLRCLAHYMQRVGPGSLPRALRSDGTASEFVDGEIVELMDSEDESAPNKAIDVEEYLLGPRLGERVNIKQEQPKRHKRRHAPATLATAAGVNGREMGTGDQSTAASTQPAPLRNLRLHELMQSTTTLQGHTSAVTSVCFSAGGETIVSGSNDKSVKIWDAATGECVQTLQGHTGVVRSVCFSAGGETIISGSWDQSVKIWDAAIGECVQTLQGHTGPVRSVCFSAGGEKIVSGSYDRSVKIWDAATGECVQTLQGHTGGVWSVCFSAGGEKIVSGSDDESVK